MYPFFMAPLFSLFTAGTGMPAYRCPACGARRGCCLSGCLTPILLVAGVLWLLARIF